MSSYYKGDRLVTEADNIPQAEHCAYRDIADPYSCTLDLWTSSSGERGLRDTLTPVLWGIDPTFKFVSIQEHQCSRPPVYLPQNGGQVRNGAHGFHVPQTDKKLSTPALAVVLFLREDGPVSPESVQQKLLNHPWSFHHKIELSNVRRMPRAGCMAQQLFYGMDLPHVTRGAAGAMPLWSVNSVHYGNEHLRFSIFTRNHNDMVDFYRTVSSREVDCRKTNFSLFELYTQPGLDIQLGLKYSPSLHPKPVSSAFLHFKVQSMRNIAPLLGHPCTALSEGVFITQDPDGNSVILEERVKSGSSRQRTGSSLRSTSALSTVRGYRYHGNRRYSQDSGHSSSPGGSDWESVVTTATTENEGASADEIIV